MRRKIAALFGRQGLGKSTLAFHLAKTETPPRTREDGERAKGGVLVFDPNAQFSNGLIVDQARELEQAADWNMAQLTAPLIFRPQGDVWREFFDFADVAWQIEGSAVIVDESSFLQNPAGIHPRLDKLVRLGRTRQLSIYTTQHRPQDAYGIYLSLATDYYFFHTTHPKDLEKIEDHCGGSSDVRQRVERLRGFEFLHWELAASSWDTNLDPPSWREQIQHAPAEDEEESEPRFTFGEDRGGIREA